MNWGSRVVGWLSRVDLSDGIALLALVLAGLSYRHTVRAAKRQDRRQANLDERQAELEAEQSRLTELQIAEHERAANERAEAVSRAKLKVTLEPGARLGTQVLVVTAHPDYGAARGVAIVPKDRDGEELPVPPEQQGARINLDPGDEHRLPVIPPSLSKGGHILVEFEWIDPDGQLRRESMKAYRR